MKWKLIICLIIVILFTTWYAPPASASDFPPYTYLAEDLSELWQDPLTPGVDNYVFRNWQLGIGAVWWATGAIEADAGAAIDNWKAAIQILTYSKRTEEGGNLNIYFGPCPGEPGAVSCYKVLDTYYDSDYRAAYINMAAIYINSNYGWTSTALKSAVAHELGRFYGLYERKLINPDACNTDELTVMDMLPVVNGQVVPCDTVEGPTALDKWRVEAYWSGGAPLHADLPISAWANGPVATYRWHDLAWAEKTHYLDFQYRNASGQWVSFVTKDDYMAYIGTHMYTQDRGMAIAIDLTAPEFEDIPGGWHRACAWAYFAAYNANGNGQCSMPVELTDPG